MNNTKTKTLAFTVVLAYLQSDDSPECYTAWVRVKPQPGWGPEQIADQAKAQAQRQCRKANGWSLRDGNDDDFTEPIVVYEGHLKAYG